MSTESPNWRDKPEETPMNMRLEYGSKKKSLALTIGNCAIALFRHRPEIDYLAVHHEEGGEWTWTFIFDKQPLIYWMGNLALTREGQRGLHLANRTHGTFESRYGWNPDIVIEDWPHQDEVDTYIEARIGMDFVDDSALYADLDNALKEDFS